ncbi:hypothetical protein ACE01N_08735 [Saccharicrinis sp. FJH2]|uniref:hypothetical protein n=1 Tax=Saccharicrinis sp. FJH65 TaxID=3344659 RepID=UPI0035F370A1
MNLEHRILSHKIFTGQEVIKKGIIRYMPDKIITAVEPTHLKHAESARTQFYSGIIVPEIYNQPFDAVKLKEILHENMDPNEFEVIDASGLGYTKLLQLLQQLQAEYNLYGRDFLEFWNKISVSAAQQNGEDYSIKPGNRIRIVNLRGLDPESYASSAHSKIIPIERNLLL